MPAAAVWWNSGRVGSQHLNVAKNSVARRASETSNAKVLANRLAEPKLMKSAYYSIGREVSMIRQPLCLDDQEYHRITSDVRLVNDEPARVWDVQSFISLFNATEFITAALGRPSEASLNSAAGDYVKALADPSFIDSVIQALKRFGQSDYIMEEVWGENDCAEMNTLIDEAIERLESCLHSPS